MKQPTKCYYCGLTYDHATARICPYCGQSPHPNGCPDPLCTLDITDSTICQNCPRKTTPHRGWGGKREGAGAPPGNLNRLVHGQNSNLLQRAIAKLAADPELRAFLLLIARAATEDVLPQSTKQLITKALETPQVKGRRLFRKVRQHSSQHFQCPHCHVWLKGDSTRCPSCKEPLTQGVKP